MPTSARNFLKLVSSGLCEVQDPNPLIQKQEAEPANTEKRQNPIIQKLKQTAC
jgi:hypothetical protein